MSDSRPDFCGLPTPPPPRKLRRRDFLMMTGAAITTMAAIPAESTEPSLMYGQIAKITAVPGKRDELAAILVEGTANMPGCLSYIVAQDTNDENAIWVSEAWDSKQSHDASLSLPSVKASISKARPLIASFGNRIVTMPVGGIGLVAPGKR